jgi:hypothetical protein
VHVKARGSPSPFALSGSPPMVPCHRRLCVGVPCALRLYFSKPKIGIKVTVQESRKIFWLM